MNNIDHQYMAKALQLAKKGQYTTHPNPRVGCVIVKDGLIIGEGYHQRAGQPHAEINALRSISSPNSSQGATAYVTLEPCSHTGKTPPCANALIDAEISRVVIAMQDPNPQVAGQGVERLKQSGIEVSIGVLEDQARALNPGFIKRMEKGLPWVRVKLAMSLDGRTAMASGESQWITGSEARQDVQFLRAKSDAVLTGIGTVLADDPSLNVRLNADDLDFDGVVKQPKRVVLDTALRMPLDSKMIELEGEIILCTASLDESRKEEFRKRNVQVLTLSSTDQSENEKRLPLEDVLKELANQEINEVHVEAGAKLCGALIQENLVDELVIYMAPTLMGSDARGLLNFTGIDKMADKVNVNIRDIRAVGSDWRITAELA